MVTKEAKFSKFFEKENWNFVDFVAELYTVQLIPAFTTMANQIPFSIKFYARKEIT